MHILQINKFFYRRGGVETVLFDTIEGLRARGHEVSEFSMMYPSNLPSEYSAYFASQMPELLGKQDLKTKFKILVRLFYSSEIKKKLGALVLATEPEVAHLHGVYHHLSASTFTKLYQLKMPTVLTLHDFFPISPSRNFLKGETLDERYYRSLLTCLRYRCVDNRLLPSLAGVMEAYYYRLRHIWDRIDLFICPSQFMADKMVEYGLPRKKMRLLYNPFQLQPTVAPLGNKVVYLGRTHVEKGIKLFMEAAKDLRQYQLVVAGGGPEDNWVQEFIRKNILTNVEKRSWVTGEEWQRAMREAKVIVVPSLFYENCSLAILEALSYGRIVVSVDRGGNPELIQNGVSGFLAKPEDSKDLARVIKRAMETDDVESARIVEQGRERLRKQHNPEAYFMGLEAIYREAISSKK